MSSTNSQCVIFGPRNGLREPWRGCMHPCGTKWVAQDPTPYTNNLINHSFLGRYYSIWICTSTSLMTKMRPISTAALCIDRQSSICGGSKNFTDEFAGINDSTILWGRGCRFMADAMPIPNLLTKCPQNAIVIFEINLKIYQSSAKTVSPAWYPNHQDMWTEKHFPSAAWHK